MGCNGLMVLLVVACCCLLCFLRLWLKARTCQKERGSGALGFRSAKLTGCPALPERQSASAMVLTKLNPTEWSIKKEVLSETHCTLEWVEMMWVVMA